MLEAAVAQEGEPRVREDDEGLNFAVTAGGSWSDNIGRVATDEEDGTVGRAGLLLGYNERSRRLETKVDTNVSYEHYFDDTFDDEVVGGVNGTLTASIVPERFKWFVQENFGQITTDPFAADTPENRENINYFTTGPDFAFGLGNAFTAALSGRYSSTTYETSELDSERYGATLALIRRLSGTTSLSLNATGESIEFEDTTLNNDYDRYQAFLRYNVQGSRTALLLDVGYTKLEFDSQESDGLLAKVSISRRVSASSIVTVGAGTQFSDAGDLFRDTQGQRGVQLGGESVLATGDPFQSRFASLGWAFERNRTALGLSAQYSEEEFENLTSADRTLTTWGGYFNRELSRAAELRLYGTLQEEKFDQLDFQDDETQLGAALAWDVGRTLELRLQYDRYDRDSTAGGTQYTENRTSLFATWWPTGRR
jgi:hypothetical protein